MATWALRYTPWTPGRSCRCPASSAGPAPGHASGSSRTHHQTPATAAAATAQQQQQYSSSNLMAAATRTTALQQSQQQPEGAHDHPATEPCRCRPARPAAPGHAAPLPCCCYCLLLLPPCCITRSSHPASMWCGACTTCWLVAAGWMQHSSKRLLPQQQQQQQQAQAQAQQQTQKTCPVLSGLGPPGPHLNHPEDGQSSRQHHSSS